MRAMGGSSFKSDTCPFLVGRAHVNFTLCAFGEKPIVPVMRLNILLRQSRYGVASLRTMCDVWVGGLGGKVAGLELDGGGLFKRQTSAQSMLGAGAEKQLPPGFLTDIAKRCAH